MIGIIYYYDVMAGLAKLTEVANAYLRSGIKTEVTNKKINSKSIKCSNGDTWTVMQAISDNIINQACNIAYIEKRIPEGFVKQYIIPTVKLPPISAYNFFLRSIISSIALI